MAHKKFGGWFGKFYAQIKVASELWSFSRIKGETSETQIQLFFIGWYEMSNKDAKLFTIGIPFVSIQFGMKR